ncbi:MAG TPA: HXXEE domain-containing protein [Solirubrobacteraceae bacterium]
MSLTDRTHGRWPWAAAAAAVPVSVAVGRARGGEADATEWLIRTALPALLWHQTEEWVWPGGFLPWFNREVVGSGEDEFPITRAAGLVINTQIGWVLAEAAAARGMRSPALGATALATNVANAGMHLSLAARRRRYNPGTASSALLFAPLGLAGLVAVARDPRGGARPVLAGLGAGAATSVGILAVRRRRLNRRRARPAVPH